MHARVVCKWEPHDVYIGRPSRWGNPIRLNDPSDDEERIECLRRYARYLDNHPRVVALARKMLADKVLGCFCAPRLCHGDILARVADGMSPMEAFEDALTSAGLVGTVLTEAESSSTPSQAN